MIKNYKSPRRKYKIEKPKYQCVKPISDEDKKLMKVLNIKVTPYWKSQLSDTNVSKIMNSSLSRSGKISMLILWSLASYSPCTDQKSITGGKKLLVNTPSGIVSAENQAIYNPRALLPYKEQEKVTSHNKKAKKVKKKVRKNEEEKATSPKNKATSPKKKAKKKAKKATKS